MKLSKALELKKNELVCFVGAGGKTGLMQNLLNDCAERGNSVLATTSTKVFKTQLSDCCPLILEEDEEQLYDRLLEVVASNRALSAGVGLNNLDKVIGLSKDFLNKLFDSRAFDHILVEADGARNLALKAPAAYEPIVPSQTTCLIVITGIDVLGKSLTEENVHRPHIVAEVTGQELGSEITPETILNVFKYYRHRHSQGYPDLRMIPVINKVDDEELLEKAKTVAQVLNPEFGKTLITSTLLQDPVWEVEL